MLADNCEFTIPMMRHTFNFNFSIYLNVFDGRTVMVHCILHTTLNVAGKLSNCFVVAADDERGAKETATRVAL
jgi:hypothetical protein